MAEFKAHFKSAQPDLGGSLPGRLIFGIPGKDGGYYLVAAEQVDANTIRFTFTPSKEDMPAVAPMEIKLPGVSAEQIAKAVEEYFAENPPTGGTVTDEQIAEAVEKYLDENEIDTDVVYVLAEGETLNDAPESADIVIDPTGTPGGGGGGGVTPTFSIGTVETLAPGSNATASISGTKENPVLNLGIPRGDDGSSDAGDDWELLNTITVSDDATTNVTFTEDSNGNPLDLKKFYLRVSGIDGTSTYPALRLNGLIWQQQFGGAVKGGTNLTIPVLFEIIGYGCYCCDWHDPFRKEIRFDGDGMTHIDSVNSILWTWATNKVITNGAIFTLYGVRA